MNRSQRRATQRHGTRRAAPADGSRADDVALLEATVALIRATGHGDLPAAVAVAKATAGRGDTDRLLAMTAFVAGQLARAVADALDVSADQALDQALAGALEALPAPEVAPVS